MAPMCSLKNSGPGTRDLTKRDAAIPPGKRMPQAKAIRTLWMTTALGTGADTSAAPPSPPSVKSTDVYPLDRRLCSLLGKGTLRHDGKRA